MCWIQCYLHSAIWANSRNKIEYIKARIKVLHAITASGRNICSGAQTSSINNMKTNTLKLLNIFFYFNYCKIEIDYSHQYYAPSSTYFIYFPLQISEHLSSRVQHLFKQDCNSSILFITSHFFDKTVESGIIKLVINDHFRFNVNSSQLTS